MFSLRAPRLTRPLLIILAGVLTLAGLLFASGPGASAHAATTRAARTGLKADTSAPKPTIVLVHGAWADSGSWNAVTALLQRAGYTVYAPPNPLRGLPTDTVTLTGFLKSISGPIVLVGHSYGGEVITNAADGNSQVKALVYDDAYLPAQGRGPAVPDHGRVLFLPARPPSRAPSSTSWPIPTSPSGEDVYVKQSVFPGCFANGLPASEGAVLAATQRPLATSALTDPSGTPGLGHDPVLGHRRHERPHHHSHRATVHGPPRAGAHHRGQRTAPVHDLQPGRRGQRHHPGRPDHRLT